MKLQHIASSVERARELIMAKMRKEWDYISENLQIPDGCSAIDHAPNRVYKLDDKCQEDVMVFEDAGCC